MEKFEITFNGILGLFILLSAVFFFLAARVIYIWVTVTNARWRSFLDYWHTANEGSMWKDMDFYFRNLMLILYSLIIIGYLSHLIGMFINKLYC